VKTTRIISATAAGLLLSACVDGRNPVEPTAINPGNPRFTRLNGAAFTTTNPTGTDAGNVADGTGHCKNGNEAINCNIYDGKKYVWLNGGPASADVGAGQPGDYFFAVLAPGGQGGGANPNDGTLKNLSDGANGDYTTRTFTRNADGSISYSGTHDFSGGKIRLMPYDDTPNPGGVYILAICRIPSSISATNKPGVDPDNCKYDAFKIFAGDGTPGAETPTVVKTASGAYDFEYKWLIEKSAGTPTASQGNASVTYNVVVSRAAENDASRNFAVTGKITVSNPNPGNITGVTITDELIGGVNKACTVEGAGSPVILGPGESEFSYSCDLSDLAAEPAATRNKVRVAWGAQPVGGLALAAGDANFQTEAPIVFTGNPINATVSVTDLFNNNGSPIAIGTLVGSGTSTVTLAEAPKTFTYTRSIPVMPNTCVTYPNRATITQTGQHADASVQICGIGNGFTLGFWSNNNGRNQLCSATPTRDPAWRAVLNGGPAGSTNPYLRNANPTVAVPFYAVPGGTCANAHSNFSSWLLSATATNMSNMLSAQLAATRLNVTYRGMPGEAYVAHPITGAPATINSIIDEAVTFLRANGNTTQSGTLRNQATAYKNLFDGLNNNSVLGVPSP
jgi:hypothetical protein